jgi:nitrite reductase/ring-hydroxylating ferredoxin subunit
MDKPLRIEPEGNSAGIVLVRTKEGVSAFSDICPHAHWRLSEGDLVNGVLECAGHGWEFDACTGKCITVPAYPLKPYSVVVEAENVRVQWD